MSAKACQGILNRAKKRNKEIPEILRTALEQSVFRSERANLGGVKDCCAQMNEQEPCRPSIYKESRQAQTVVLEGNGSRPSHNGDGYSESDVSPTLNSTEVHAVAFSQDAYDSYSENDASATIKQTGGVYGGGSECLVIQ